MVLVVFCLAGAQGISADVSVVNFFTTDDMLFGLHSDSYHIFGVDHIEDEVEGYYFDGSTYGSIPIDYSGSPFPWGVTVVAGIGNYYTDFTSSSIYIETGGAWETITDPAGVYGRGIAWNGQYLWEADGDYSGNGNGFYRFESDGTGALFFATPELQGYMTGLARFSFDSTEYVVVTASEDFNFYFYETDGTYAGSAQVPMPIS
ncbi:MAG: hypothetical protein GF388_00055 [Candidatus Aegiribacteria sp.]|nr:hypothetical protein [Candidatus Aegiribacteria sp.]